MTDHTTFFPVSLFCLQYVMELTFTEAAKGANKELSVNIEDNCPRCDGKGNEPGTKVSLCHFCNGTGMVSFRLTRDVLLSWRAVLLVRKHLSFLFVLLQESISTGPFMMRSSCRRCRGKGSIINTPCALCRGSGQTKKRHTVAVPVPAGEFLHFDQVLEICPENRKMFVSLVG